MVDEIRFRVEELPRLAALENEWRALEAAARPSFFTSWQWIGTLLAALPEVSRPNLLRGAVDGGTIALALLGKAATRRRRGLIGSRGLFINETGNPRFDAIEIEHNALLAPTACEASVVDALVAWFAGLGKEADELRLNGSLERLPEEAVEGRGLRRREISMPSYSVELRHLEQSGGEICSVLSANSRQQLRRAMRIFERLGPLELAEARTKAEALAFFAAMKTLHTRSWERRNRRHAFSGCFFERFHRLLLTEGFASGGVQMLRVRAGEHVLGYLYNFRCGDRIYAYQSGFADADRHQRPGVVAHALAIRHAFRAGAQVYDFMAGHNRLKESFATNCQPMLWQVVQHPRLVFRLEDSACRVWHAIRTRTSVFDKPKCASGILNRSEISGGDFA